MLSYDVVVIGAGIAGVSVGYELAADRSVAVLERERTLAAHSTGRSAAMFIDSYGGLQVRILAKASRSFLDEPPQGWDQPLLSPRGALYVGFAQEDDQVHQLFEELRPVNEQVVLLGADACLRLWPLLRPQRQPTGVHDPLAMDLDVHALHSGYVRGLRARGGSIVAGAGVREMTRAGAGWLLTADDGTQVRAAAVVNAAGAWADEVAATAGARPVGLQPMARSIFVAARPDIDGAARWPLVQDLRQRWYLKPEGDALLCSPSNETPVRAADPRPEETLIAQAISELAVDTLLTITHVRHAWAGLRVFAPDRVPVVGYDPEREGLFWLAGQGGYGIQTAPATARLAAALVRGQDVPADLAALDLAAASLGPARPSLAEARGSGPG